MTRATTTDMRVSARPGESGRRGSPDSRVQNISVLINPFILQVTR